MHCVHAYNLGLRVLRVGADHRRGQLGKVSGEGACIPPTQMGLAACVEEWIELRQNRGMAWKARSALNFSQDGFDGKGSDWLKRDQRYDGGVIKSALC